MAGIISKILQKMRRTKMPPPSRQYPSFVLAETFKQHNSYLTDAVSSSPFIIFLCGPTIKDTQKLSSILRKKMKKEFEANKFEVVLGEDDGLEDVRLKLGMNAQDNELEYIRKNCNALIIIADSVGAFCELGLFSWHFTHVDGDINNSGLRTDCFVLIDRKYQGDASYLNEGPARAVNAFGSVQFVDFSSFDCSPLIKKLEDRRVIISLDNKRGRPRRRKP